MTKKDIAVVMAERLGRDLDPVRCEAALDCAFDVIADALERGEDVRIRRFGTFAVRKYSARDAVNPRTQESIYIKARLTPIFRPTKLLKQRISQKHDI